MTAETAGKHYSAAFRDRPIQIWSGNESARTSIVLARLLAEDAAAAEVRNDYEAAYERYFASADALFRAARALDTDQASSASPAVLKPVVKTAYSCCDSDQKSCREVASASELTMRTLCYRQIEALIARCEAIREYLYASTMAEDEPVDSSSDENSAIAVNMIGEKTSVAAPKTREAVGIGSESVGPQLQRRFEACRTMQEALEQSRSAAWLLDAAAIPTIPQQGHERASARFRRTHASMIASCDQISRPNGGSGFHLCDVTGLPRGERQGLLDQRGTNTSPSEAKTPSPARVRRFLLHSPAGRLSSDVSSDTKTPSATDGSGGAAWPMTPENPITEDAHGMLAKRIATSRADAAIPSQTRVPAETSHRGSSPSVGLLRNALHGDVFPADLAASAMQDSEQLRDDSIPSAGYRVDLGHVPNKVLAGSAQSIDSQKSGNRNPPAVPRRPSVSPPEHHSPACSARQAEHHASCSVSDDTSPFRSVLDEPTDQNPLDRTLGPVDAAAFGATAAAQPPDSESAAAASDPRLIIQRELVRRFRELRQRQQDRHADEHPSDQPSLWVTDDVPNRDAEPAQAALSTASHDTTFDTTFSSGWRSNHSSISRSRYEAMKTRVALMRERLGKMMLAGNATATIVMPAASQNETFSVQHAASRETTPTNTLPRTASSSPGSLGAASNALQLSHAIVNLHAGTFGEFKRLEPLPVQAASRWSMEIDFLLSPCEQIIVRTPVRRQLADGTSVEVLESRLRPDIEEYLPRLRGMDQAIREMLRSFRELSGTLKYEPTGTRGPQWWLEQPQIPPGGLPPGVRALLQRNFQEAADIRHLARDINERILRSLPCPAREYAFSCFGYDLTEATGGWSLTPRRRPAARVRDVLGPELHEALSRNPAFSAVAYARSVVLGLSPDAVLPSWIDADDVNERLTRLVEQLERAEFLYRVKIDRLNQAGRFGAPWRREKLERYYAARRRCERGAHALREVFTGIGHTTRDQCAIRYNVDVGSAILEAYSRVLEHRAAAICKRIRLCLETEQQQQQQALNETARVSLRASSSRLEVFHSRRRDPAASGGRQQRESQASHRGCALERPRTMPNGLWARDHWRLALGRSAGTQVDINRTNERPSSRIPDPAGILPVLSTDESVEPCTSKATAPCSTETSARRHPTPHVASGAETLPAQRIPMTAWSDLAGSSAALSEHRKSIARPLERPPSRQSGSPRTDSEQGPV